MSLDVKALVAQLMVVEARPLNVLKAKEKQTQAKIDAFSRLQGGVSSMQTAVEKLAKPGTWGGSKATVTGDGVAAAVTDSSKVTPGRYTVKVEQLAVAHALASGTQYKDADTVIGGGKFTLQVGEGEAIEIELKADATLADLRNAINGAKAGVSASIVMNGDQVQLALVATDTGAKNTVTLSAADDASAGLKALSAGLTTTRAPADAVFEVNGLKLVSASNKVSGAIEGVTFDLKKSSETDESQIVIERDTASMKASVNEFIKGYNDLQSTIKSLAGFNPETKTAGLLNGDALVRGLQDQMRGLLRVSVPGGETGFGSLSDIGIAVQPDGTLKLDDEKFTQALENPDAVARLFSAESDNEAEQGIALRFKAITDRMVGDDGLITLRSKSLKSQIDGYAKDSDRMNLRLDQTESRLIKQYTALDVQLSAMQNQSVALANALAGLPGAQR